MSAGDVDQRIRDIQREYAEFLDDYVGTCWFELTIQ
jgi:hypothetical protein